MNFAKELKDLEEFARNIRDKESRIVDVTAISEIAQVKAHIHGAYVTLKRMHKEDPV
jgi:hypothetical protein